MSKRVQYELLMILLSKWLGKQLYMNANSCTGNAMSQDILVIDCECVTSENSCRLSDSLSSNISSPQSWLLPHLKLLIWSSVYIRSRYVPCKTHAHLGHMCRVCYESGGNLRIIIPTLSLRSSSFTWISVFVRCLFVFSVSRSRVEGQLFTQYVQSDLRCTYLWFTSLIWTTSSVFGLGLPTITTRSVR